MNEFDKKFFAWIGLVYTLFALMVLAILTIGSLSEIYKSIHDDSPTFVLPPDTAHVHKPVKAVK